MIEEVLQVLPQKFRQCVREQWKTDKLQEIRFRVGQPVEVSGMQRKVLKTEIVTQRDVREMLEYISRYSLYAFDEQIAQGYLTIPGGHRVGVAGEVVVEQGKVKNMRHISFANVRIAHEVYDCGRKILHHIREGERIRNTLIISPPCCGKTTLLRDLTRLISGEIGDEQGKHVVVIDERSEIAGCYQGVPQKDIGCRTDVLDGCPKSVGMMMAVRSLAPELLVVDEMGGKEDMKALQMVMNSGCALLASVHGKSREEAEAKFEREGGGHCFQRYVILSGSCPGQVKEIIDEKGRVLYVGKRIGDCASGVGDNRIRYVSGRKVCESAQQFI